MRDRRNPPRTLDLRQSIGALEVVEGARRAVQCLHSQRRLREAWRELGLHRRNAVLLRGKREQGDLFAIAGDVAQIDKMIG